MTFRYATEEDCNLILSFIRGLASYEKMSDQPTEKHLKKRGIGVVGPVITYSFLQAVGIVNDHLAGCAYR